MNKHRSQRSISSIVNMFRLNWVLVVVCALLAAVFATRHLDYDDQKARNLLSLAAAPFSPNPGICVDRIYGPRHDWIVIGREVVNLTSGVAVSVVVIDSASLNETIISLAVSENDLNRTLEVFALAPYIPVLDLGDVNTVGLEWHYAVWKHVSASVSKLPEGRTITVTGWSLGGGLATLTAMYLRHTKTAIKDIRIVTFGEPRIGTLSFANMVDRELTHAHRITHRDDPVVHVPACPTMIAAVCAPNSPNGVHHHGIEIFYDNDMRYGANFVRCWTADEDARCSDGRIGKGNFDDHRIYFQHDVIVYGSRGCSDATRSGAAVLMMPASASASVLVPVLVFVITRYVLQS